MMIITDTASDILENEAVKMGVRLVKIGCNFGDMTCDENTEEGFDRFYEMLKQCEELPVSSQPSPESYLALYEEAMDKDEDVLVITISGKLSGTYNCAMLAKNISGYDKIQVVDSRQASISERLMVEYAVRLRDSGMSVEEIEEKLIDIRDRICLYGIPATLLYLKKGGRISSLKAAVGNVLGIVPVLFLENGRIDSKDKVRGKKAAREALLATIEKMPIDNEFPLYLGYSGGGEGGDRFLNDMKERTKKEDIKLYNVGPAIGTHTGPQAMLVAFVV